MFDRLIQAMPKFGYVTERYGRGGIRKKLKPEDLRKAIEIMKEVMNG